MKKPKSVADAESAVRAKLDELNSAKDVVRRLESEHADAIAAVRRAQEEADATLQQCRMVRILWRDSKEEDICRVVIMRKTPGGMLVVRRVGETTGSEYKFKWTESSGKYRQAEKRSSFVSNSRELRDVPAEYLHTSKAV